MKPTTKMTQQEKQNLQNKLDALLKETIQKVHALKYNTYPIEKRVRITNNKTRLGSAQVTNKAQLIKTKTNRRSPQKETWNKTPKFRISISTKECNTKKDILNTLFHEVIHTIPGCFNHGKAFKEAADKINKTYNTQIQTSKRDIEKSSEINTISKDPNLKSKLNKYIGRKIIIRNKTYTFTGINTRPKNCCEITDTKGNIYITNTYTIAKALKLI